MLSAPFSTSSSLRNCSRLLPGFQREVVFKDMLRQTCAHKPTLRSAAHIFGLFWRCQGHSVWFLIHTAAGAHPFDPNPREPPGLRPPGKAGAANPEENTSKTEF